MKAKRCELCERWVDRVERHHLVPRTRHRTRRNREACPPREVLERVIRLCRPCHRMLHATLTNKQLEREYNTLASIAAHPAMRTFVGWIRKRPADRGVRVRRGAEDAARAEAQTRRRRRKEKLDQQEGPEGQG